MEVEEMKMVGEGRRKIGEEKSKYHLGSDEISREQTKFFIDLSSDRASLAMVADLLKKANAKELGRQIQFKDIVLHALTKISEKDIERIQEASLTEMEKVQRVLDEHNKKSGTKLSMGEFLIKRLGIN